MSLLSAENYVDSLHKFCIETTMFQFNDVKQPVYVKVINDN